MCFGQLPGLYECSDCVHRKGSKQMDPIIKLCNVSNYFPVKPRLVMRIHTHKVAVYGFTLTVFSGRALITCPTVTMNL